MGARYIVRLMFEWGGGCLWCGNDTGLAGFGVGPVEDRLPLSQETRQRLTELSAWHDRALNWDNPQGPGPWSAAERERFERAAAELLRVVRAELGLDFEVIYVSL